MVGSQSGSQTDKADIPKMRLRITHTLHETINVQKVIENYYLNNTRNQMFLKNELIKPNTHNKTPKCKVIGGVNPTPVLQLERLSPFQALPRLAR
jgi:hypothetical protein